MLKKNRKWQQHPTPAQLVDDVAKSTQASAERTLRQDREMLRKLPDVFSTTDAHDRLGKSIYDATHAALICLAEAGLIEQAKRTVPRVWRKTEHGKNFEKEAGE